MPRKGQFKAKVKCADLECSKFSVCKGFCNFHYRLEKKKDPEYAKILQQRQKKYQTKEYQRVTRLKSYGLTEEDYQKLCISQRGLCDICKMPPLEKGVLHIDHCHETGKVRGLLCRSCNMSLGNLKHSLSIIDSSIRYLKSRP